MSDVYIQTYEVFGQILGYKAVTTEPEQESDDFLWKRTLTGRLSPLEAGGKEMWLHANLACRAFDRQSLKIVPAGQFESELALTTDIFIEEGRDHPRQEALERFSFPIDGTLILQEGPMHVPHRYSLNFNVGETALEPWSETPTYMEGVYNGEIEVVDIADQKGAPVPMGSLLEFAKSHPDDLVSKRSEQLDITMMALAMDADFEARGDSIDDLKEFLEEQYMVPFDYVE